MVRSITSAFLVALGSAQTDKTEDCRSGTTAERRKIHSFVSHCSRFSVAMVLFCIKKYLTMSCFSLGPYNANVCSGKKLQKHFQCHLPNFQSY